MTKRKQWRRFEFSEGTSNKFWQIRDEGTSYRVRYGRIGSDGQESVKEFGTAEECAAAVEKIVRQKTAKGYVEVGASGSAATKATKKAMKATKATKPTKANKAIKKAMKAKRSFRCRSAVVPCLSAFRIVNFETIF